MTEESQNAVPAASWKAAQVYTLAAVCLALGLALGYLFRGSQSRPAPPPVAAAASQPAMPTTGMGEGHGMPTLEQMKQMADTKAQPLLDQLKSDPKNADLLIQVARIYQSTHQFKEAAAYLERALQIHPGDTDTRTQMASDLYYGGDVDGAIGELGQVLQKQPKDVNALFNVGIIKWKGKNDAAGAIAAWNQLLKSNPQLADARKAQVKKLIAEAGQPKTAN